MKTYNRQYANNNFLLDPFFNGFFDFGESGTRRTDFLMKTDVTEDDKAFTITTDLPGVKKEQVEVELDKGYLTISATVCESEDDEKKNYLRRERVCRSAKRSFYVGDDVSEDDIKAELNDGVLSVTVAKREKVLPEVKKISIN